MRWALSLCLILVGTPLGTAALEVPTTSVPLLLAEVQGSQQHHSDSESDEDESWLSTPHQKLRKGQNPRVDVTAPPTGYEGKRLNRLWGRFRGAKTGTRGEKHHK